ncbi:MAG TPA: hypothetical protein VF491_27160 [Vicinamibacterales bacterium]|jgi:hypothetical protein
MVTRRAVLKGTAAASIGAIAAAHGATPAAAADGYGLLEGGAVGGFYKYNDAFQVSLKFHKFAADVFFKEDGFGSVAIFFKFFHKDWSALETQSITNGLFPNLKDTDLHFSKFNSGKAEFFLKDTVTLNSIKGTIDTTSTDGVFYKFEEEEYKYDIG